MCLNQSAELEILNKKIVEMNLTNSDSFITDEDIVLGSELFIVLHYCSTSVQESIKLDTFYKELLTKQSLRTIVQATMNNVLPGTTTLKDSTTMITFFTKLDKMFNFTHNLTRLLAAISSSDQLKELVKLGLPFVDPFNDIIKQCLNNSRCQHVSEVSEIAGNLLIKCKEV